MQSPPPYVPVVEYVLKALEHPPFMYVAKLVACCTVLFLTRENPELLQDLCHKWALRFRRDRAKLVASIRNRASYCVNSPEGSMELETSDKLNGEEVGDAADGERCSGDARSQSHGEEEAMGGIRCCDPDTAVEHLLSILNTLVPMYFSWNWHRADYVIQINKEYEAYVREFILPVCTSLAPDEGVDDEERTPWLLPPHTYLDAAQNTLGFYTPTSGVGQFPPPKATDARHTTSQGAGSSGAVPSTPKLTAPAATTCGGAPLQLENSAVATTVANHYASTPTGRRSAERHTGVTANPLPRFSPLHPSFAPSSTRDVVARSPHQGPMAMVPAHSLQSAALQASGSSTVSVPAMSPNVMSAGVFNTSAVYGLRFLTLGSYRAALRHNTRGLVTVFHAKYSTRSNEVIEAFQKIAARRLLNPMPTIAVVYAVAEPELSTLYKVSWFPTIVYTPPLSAQASSRRGSTKAQVGSSQGHREDGSSSGRRRLPAGVKRHGPPDRHHRGKRSGGRHHAHSHQQRHSAMSGSVSQQHSTASPPLSGSDSLADLESTGGAAQYEAEERAKWEAPPCEAAAPDPARDESAAAAAAAAASPHVVIPLQSLAVTKTAEAAVPLAATTIAAAPSNHLAPYGTSRVDNTSITALSDASGRVSSKVPMTPTPTELLFGISVGESTPMLPGQSPTRGGGGGGSIENASLTSSAEEGGAAQQPSASHLQLQQPLLEMVERDDHVIYPLRGDLTVPALVEWISARGASVPRLSKLRDPSICLRAIRKEEMFKCYRELHSAVVTLRRLQGQGNGDASASSSSEAGQSPTSNGKASQQPEQPLFIFLGGGMAAGKTTAVAALAKSSWWQGHKEQSVVVNADEFKVPLEFETSSADAHQHSTRAAENLLVRAVNQGRSIVLDGTMMWKPFVQHVVNMVRVAHLTLFKQGPGYDAKTKTEQYFAADKARRPPLPLPYKIIFLGITVDVETAVPRGFLRKFSTNRGVPISMQLRSFKLFSENFADYVAMVDETTLYNNNVFVDLEKGELPPVLAECTEETGNKLVIHDEAAFHQFLRQQQINENADNMMQVYPATPMTTEISS